MKKFIQRAGNLLLPFFLTLLMKTLRYRITGKPSRGKCRVFIFWHNKMAAGWWIVRDIKPAALVSQSSDGELLSSVLSEWNYKVVRGSSSKGAKEAVTALSELVHKDYSVVITPDGPRGPLYVIKNGPFLISNKSGIPIMPVKVKYSRKIVLKNSWDKFEIPLPFSECKVTFGSEYDYKEYLDEKEFENLKKRISDEM